MWCLLGIGAGIYLFVHGFRLLQRRRLILDTPFSKIRSASMGMVEVTGLAAGPYTMIAPITGHPCYFYRTLVWEWKQSGKNKTWVKVAAECTHVPFFLDDNTGRVLVDPHGADLDLHQDFKQEFCDSLFTIKDPAPPNVNSFLSRHGIVTSNKIKVEEYCIKPKNALFILGTLAENPDIDIAPEPIADPESLDSISQSAFAISTNSLAFSVAAGAGTVASSLLQKLSPSSEAYTLKVVQASSTRSPAKALDKEQQQKIADALAKAGISSPAAWQAAGLGNQSVQVTSTDGFDQHPPVVLKKGVNNPTFLISWRSQREVVRSLGWKCTPMIWGGPALALLSLYVLLNAVHML